MSNRQSRHFTAAAKKAAAADVWLRGIIGECRREAMAGDAGHRQYFRIFAKDGGGSNGRKGDNKGGRFVLMIDDAAGVDTFARMRGLFAKTMTAPRVIAKDGGFCLLEDFGDNWYLRARNKSNCGALYNAAIRALARMQTTPPPRFVRFYDDAMLRAEMLLFDSWYCRRHLRRKLSAPECKALANARDFLSAEIIRQGKVLVHRDYHCRNLMVVGKRSPGVLDFQDAVCGSPFYDVVSLLRDAYTYWTMAEQKKMLQYYCKHAKKGGIKLPDDFAGSWRMFNIIGAQRGLKVLGIFARLVLRDNKAGFLRPMPLARRHLLRACAEVPELSALGDIIRGL